MEPVTLTAVATAIATLLLTKALEKTGENLGDAAWQQSRKLIEQLRSKNKLPLLTNATQANEQQRLDYGQAVLELKAAADKDPEIAQQVVEVEAAVNKDKFRECKGNSKLSRGNQVSAVSCQQFCEVSRGDKSRERRNGCSTNYNWGTT
jgi:hypothetical protein